MDYEEARAEAQAERDLEDEADLAEGAFEALADLVEPGVKKLQKAMDPDNVATELRDMLDASACKLVDGAYVSRSGEVATFRVSSLVERYSGPFDVQAAAMGLAHAAGTTVAAASSQVLRASARGASTRTRPSRSTCSGASTRRGRSSCCRCPHRQRPSMRTRLRWRRM